MAEKIGILIVDDEKDFARGLSRLISGRFPDCYTQEANTGEEALKQLARTNFHILISDLRMPKMDGMELLRQALEQNSGLSAVMLTAYGDIETAVEAIRVGAYDFLTKPIEPQQLFRVLEKGMERSRLIIENRELKRLIESGKHSARLIGESPEMEKLRQTISAVAASDYTVLIRGESGTGKELVSRMVHDLSPRSGNPFVSVNCPAIPANLLESELFGHIKGAFTGADRDRKGLFVTAGNGTIHLDEIGDISQDTQTKLLRCLQEKEIRPVGSSTNIPVNARVIASTNQELEQKIRDRSFREDLYYRLNVLTLNIPPLRERKEDIPLLARYFLSQSCAEMGMQPKDMATGVLSLLTARDWPGNVRELQNFMRKLAVFSRGEQVKAEDVSIADSGTRGPGDQQRLPYKEAKAAVMDEFSKNYVTDLLQNCAGNISEAARISGLSRMALQKIITRLEIDIENIRETGI